VIEIARLKPSRSIARTPEALARHLEENAMRSTARHCAAALAIAFVALGAGRLLAQNGRALRRRGKTVAALSHVNRAHRLRIFGVDRDASRGGG
jgi:Flp pilus assembly protein TadD